MASSLARQLERLAAPQSALVVHKKSRPSLLFDKREAALLDRDTVFSIGVDGFEDLLNLNPAFLKYQETLFSENAKTMERSIQTKEVNDQLDEVIEEFLCLLCPYFLLKPAQKAIEWLVYRFHIHDFNVNALLRCIFPYHDTNIFVRALQLLRLKEETNRWHWLYPLQNPGVPLSKAALAKHCAENISFMKFLCLMNKKLVKVHGPSATSLHAPVAFFVTALAAALERCGAVSEPQVALLVPHLLRCLRSPLHELRAGGYILTIQLARRATLSQELTDRLFTALAKSLSEPLEAECVAALAGLAQTQTLALAPADALAHLGASAAPQLTERLAELSQRRSVLQLVTCLLLRCLLESADGDESAAVMATSLASDVRLQVPWEQEALIRSVAGLFCERQSRVSALLSAVVPVLTAMERMYPGPFDAALGRLESGGGRRMATLRSALRGRVAGAVGCGVYVDLNHPEESTRFEAVKHLMMALRKDEVSDAELARQALVAALADDSDRIARLALKAPVEKTLELLGNEQELTSLLTACLDAGHGEQVQWLCARALARLHVLSDDPSRPPHAALLTALLPATWTDHTVHHLSKLLAEPVCPGLASFLSSQPSCDRAAYLECALQQLSSLLTALPAPGRRSALTALSARFASSRLPRQTRVAAAALTAAVLGRDGDGAREVADQIHGMLQDARMKVSGALSAEVTPLDLLQSEEAASLPAGLVCLTSAVIAAARQTDLSGIQWWCRSVSESDRLAALVWVYRSTALGLSHPKSRAQPLHQAIIAKIFKTCLPSLSSQAAFLAQFWSAAPAAVPSEPAAVAAEVAALVMAGALLSPAPAARLAPLMAPGAPLLPALLVALQSPLAQVRTAAMECVQKLATVKAAKSKCPLLPLATQLVEYQQEIITDPEALQRCMTEGSRGWLPQLVEVVVSEDVPDHVRAALAALLPPVADQETLRRCAPVLSGLLSAASSSRLPAARAALTAALIRLVTPDTAPCLPAVWQTVAAALTAETDCLEIDGSSVSPQSLMLKQMTKQVFSALDEATQKQVLTLLLDLCTDTEQAAVASRIQKVLKRLPLTAELIAAQFGEQEQDVLEAKQTVREVRSTRRRAAAARSSSAAAAVPAPAAPDAAAAAALPPEEASVDQRPWRRRAVLLELLQSRRRRLAGSERLVAPLFALLRRLLRLPDQQQAEYPRQLALTCLQQACERLRDAAEPPPAALQASFSVETLVHCVRTSEQPQTHQLALIVLGMAAAMLPEMVLHNIMAIFTFMGSSMLRQDNEYSFRVIEKTVESVIPALLQASSLVSAGGGGDGDGSDEARVMVPVLRVFVDAVRDVPRHRRLPLFSHLLRTVGEQRHLWTTLVMLSDQLATRGDVRDKMAEDTVTVTGEKSSPVLVEFAVNLCAEFSLEVQLESCSRLLEHTEAVMDSRHAAAENTRASPRRRRDSRSETVPADEAALFDTEAHTDKQFYRHCHTTVGVIAQLLASEKFVAQSASLSAEGAAAAQTQHQRLLERTVRLITSCSRLCQGPLRDRDDHVRHVRAILHRLYALLDKINSLLPSAMFLSVISGLLGSPLAVVRRRAMELLATRLQLQPDYFTEGDTDQLLRLANDLVSVAQSAGDAETQDDTAVSRQTALFALKLLSRLLAAKHPAQFVPVLRVVCELAAERDLPAPLFASCLLCAAELCSSLRAHAISRLPELAAALLAVLQDTQRLSSELVLVSAVTLAQKVTEALPHFISPYLPELLRHCCRLSAQHAARGATSPLQHRLRQTRHQLATSVPVRVLVPAVDQCFQRLTEDGSSGVSHLMAVLAESVTSAELTELNAVLPELQALVISALEYRSSAADTAPSSAADRRSVEADVIGAVTSLVPRLSETTFRPFFLRLLDWATRAGAAPARLVTFYRLTGALADRLKGLFVLFAGHFVRHLATVLENTNSTSETPILPGDEMSSCELAQHAIDTLCKVCSHDTEGFLNRERFNTLMQPLIDQLENSQGSEEVRRERVSDHLVPCLVHFLVAAGDDSLWKPANYQLLLKMRHQTPEVRLAAVAALSAVHARLGDDYMTLLPETMPFLAELLEDEDAAVETACQRLIHEMEQTLGESLQKYF